MLIPFTRYNRSIVANKKLKPADKDKKLLQDVICLENLKKNYLEAKKKSYDEEYTDEKAKAVEEFTVYRDGVIGYIADILKDYKKNKLEEYYCKDSSLLIA